MSRYEEVDHTGDWALRVRGKDFAALLVNAAEGMLSLMGARPGPGSRRNRTFSLRALDREGLLVVWLEELLFAIEKRHVTFTRFQMEEASDLALTARALEAPLASLDKSIKAVTFHGLALHSTPEGMETTLVFDV